MESMTNFMAKLSSAVKSHVDETRDCIGKEVIDSTASRNGLCVDKIKTYFGVKFSLIGHNYSESEKRTTEKISEDMLVCQGNNGSRMFIPESEIVAIGNSVILVSKNLGQNDLGDSAARKEQIFKKYFKTKESLKKMLPSIETPQPRQKRKISITRLFH